MSIKPKVDIDVLLYMFQEYEITSVFGMGTGVTSLL
ncbi:hypothetical protein SaO268_0483 [Staphylococcus aureus]|nr:hypothetical protein SaO268_0483 [Staphylococcus aureus]